MLGFFRSGRPPGRDDNVCTVMPPRHITLKDVARKAGVSPSTVSRAIGRERLLSAKTRDKVLAACRELGYVPNLLAAGLRGARSRTLGVVVPTITNAFFGLVAQGIQSAAAESGYGTLLSCLEESARGQDDALSALVSRRVDGLVVAGYCDEGQAIRRILDHGYPVVLVDHPARRLRCDSVLIDHQASTAAAVGRLMELGHRRIALITPSAADIWPRLARIEGYRSALAGARRRADPRLAVQVPATFEAGAGAVRALLSLPRPPTAFCVLNLTLAIGAMREIRRSGLRIPDDVSFLTFDEPEWAELLTPALSAVRQPAFEVGVKAGRLVIERLRNRRKPFESAYLQAEFIERESISRPPAAGLRSLETVAR